jgi:GAF domain-containing protein
MPLTSGDRILGVMEVLDKIDAPSFGMQDMELLGIFAGQAALAIEMSQGLERLGEALIGGLKNLADLAPSGKLLAVLQERPDTARRGDLLELAALLNDVSQLGEDERKTAVKILSAFADYSQNRRRTGRTARR